MYFGYKLLTSVGREQLMCSGWSVRVFSLPGAGQSEVVDLLQSSSGNILTHLMSGLCQGQLQWCVLMTVFKACALRL